MFYNSQDSFIKFKDISYFKELSLDFLHKKLNDFHTKCTRFKNVSPQTKEKEYLKEKVKGSAGVLFNELYYIYKKRYSEEKSGLNTKDIKKFD